MKQIMKSLCLAAMALSVACTVNGPEEPITVRTLPEEIQASIEPYSDSDVTRVYVNDDLHVLWNSGDRVSVFFFTTANTQYNYKGETGSTEGSFSYISGDETSGSLIGNVYAVYPYQDNTSMTAGECIHLDLPGRQAYAAKSFGPGANTMVSRFDGEVMLFRNLCGYLTFKLRGKGSSVSSLTLRGNNGECLSGSASVKFGQDNIPVIESISKNADSGEIVVECPNPVALGAKDTEFCIVIPPLRFTKGFTLKIIMSDGSIYEKSLTTDFTVQRNRRIKVETLDVTALTPVYSGDGVFTINNKTAGALKNSLDELIASIGGPITSLRVTGPLDASDVAAVQSLRSVKSLDLREAGIPSGFFYSYDRNLEYLYLPDSMTELGVSALEYNTALKYVYGQNINKLCYRSLAFCNSLAELSLPQVVTIENNAFAGCSSLTELVFPKAKTIEASAFSGCSGVKEVSLESLEELESGVFSGSAPLNIESISLPNLIKVADYAFQGQQKLKKINLPSLKQLGKHILADSSVEEIIFHSLTEIPADSFLGNKNLRRVYGKKVKWVGQRAFQGCERLKDVSLPDADTFEAFAFYGCTLGGDLEFYSLQYIGASCFAYSSGIGSGVLMLPLALWIGDSAFMNSGVISIKIPLVHTISSHAFFGCSSLMSINENNTLICTAIENYAFANCTSLGSLTFPQLHELGSSCFDGSGIHYLCFGNLPWKQRDEFDCPVAPFEFWQFPIGSNTEVISLVINDVESKPIVDDDHPWWKDGLDEYGNRFYTFLRRRWASVSPYR